MKYFDKPQLEPSVERTLDEIERDYADERIAEYNWERKKIILEYERQLALEKRLRAMSEEERELFGYYFDPCTEQIVCKSKLQQKVTMVSPKQNIKIKEDEIVCLNPISYEGAKWFTDHDLNLRKCFWDYYQRTGKRLCV